MRKICVFTGIRAEYGLLCPVMRHIQQKDGATLQTIVSGTHLEANFGHTVDGILSDGIPISAQVEIAQSGASTSSTCASMGLGCIRLSDVLVNLAPDILVVLGDRYEAFIMAAIATVCRIPLAHIHGGEATFGSIDEAFRHSITKMSHLHFTSCDEHRQRVVQLGEDPKRVFNVGSLGVENIHTLTLISEKETRAELDLASHIPYFVCTVHPVTLDSVSIATQIAGLLEALATYPEYAVLFTGANADLGGSAINAILQKYVADNMRHRFFVSLGVRLYLSAVKYASCVIGNSSSGIIEVSSLGTPVIDIGDRQKRRIRAASVLHCEPDTESIKAMLAKALTREHAQKAAATPNPYDKQGTAQAIAETLCSWPLDAILKKQFYDIKSMLSG